MAINLALIDPKIKTDFRVIKDEPDEAILSSITKDLTHGEQYRYGISTIKNCCSGVAVQHPPVNPAGVKVLFQHREIIDIGTAAAPAEAPVTVSVTISVPQSDVITGTLMETHIAKAISALYQDAEQVNLQSTLNALIRGALVPVGL